MRVSEFWIAMANEFGDAYSRMLARDLVLTEVRGLTAEQAIAAGLEPRRVWLAVCQASDVPSERRHGAGLLPER